MKTLVSLSMPIMASTFLGTVYSITDMAWIGLLGANAVAGVGVGGMYIWLSSGLSTLTRMGGQVNAAQAIGRGDNRRAQEYARASLQMVVLLGILFGLVCVLFVKPLVGFFALTEERAVSAAIVYTRIACGLVLFSFLNFTLTGLYTAQGDSRTPFLANLVGLGINMILDPALILGIGLFPRMEAAGAAAATVAAQAAVTLVMAVSSICGGEDNILKKIKIWKPCGRACYKDVLRIGFPSGIQTMAYCGISMVLTRMLSGFSSAVVAVNRVGGQIESVSWNTADGFGAAMNAFAGQNYGAGRMDRVREGYRISFRSVLCWGLLITLLFLAFPGRISGVFFHEAGIIAQSVRYLQIISISEAMMCVELMTIGALSGLGMTRLCSIISIALTGVRLPAAYFLSRTVLGVNGIWLALSITSLVKGIVFYFIFKRKTSEM